MRKPEEFEDVAFPNDPAWVFRGIVKRVVDGDTFDVLVDQGFNQYGYVTVRLRNVDTPEIFRPETEKERERGFKAKRLVERLVMDKPVLLHTYKDKTSFGRYIASVVFTDPETGVSQSLGARLIREGLAEPSNG